MPDKDGKLTSDETEKIKKWLDEHLATNACPACGFNEWGIGEQLALAPTFNPGGIFVIGAGYPAVVVFCARCSFFRMHSAMLIGVVPPDPSTDKATEAKDGTT